MNKRQQLIYILADGNFHSGDELGKQLSMTRAGIWKLIKQIEQLGITIHAVTGKGYQLPGGLQLLDAEAIKARLNDSDNTTLELHEILDSTNSYLFNLAKADKAKSGHVVQAEQMTNGKGRRGRRWHAPYGQNVYISLLREFNSDPCRLAGLSLALAVAVVRALKQLGIDSGLSVKWPNDISFHGKKLGGILIEMQAESHNTTKIVAGIGVNVNMLVAASFDKPWTSLQQITGKPISRNLVSASIINHSQRAFNEFAESYLDSFIPEWKALDSIFGKQITIELPHKNISGQCEGINNRGEIVLNTNGIRKTISIGEVSV